MRTISFGNLSRGLSVGEQGTPVELVEEEWWVTPMRIIPPRHVMNALFATGGSRLGFTWAPFTIDAGEWKEIAAAFEARGCRTMDPPAWVRTPMDWSAWRMEVTRGVPAQESLRSAARDERLNEQIQEALAAGDQERMLTLQAERVTGEDRMELLRPLRDGGSRDPGSGTLRVSLRATGATDPWRRL